MPLVQHTLPQGQRLAVYYAECLRTALEARSTSEDPEYQNLDVRMAGFAQANERTLRAFLAALQQRILAQDGALSPLQLDEIFVAACKTHGCRTVLPPTATAALEAPEAKKPRVRKLAPVAAAASDDDGDEPIEAVPVKSVNAAPGTKAPQGAPVAAVRQPSDALAMAAKARDQAAFDAAAADISAGALDDATREAAFERDLRCANPASEDGSGESELGESDAERLDTDSESAPSSDPGQGSAPYASDTSKPAYFGPFGSPDRDVPQAPPEGEREGGPYLPRYVSPVLMPLTKWYAHLTAKPRDLERAIGLLFTNGLDDAKQTLLVRELAQEGPKGIALDRFLGACGLRRPERLLLGRLAHRTEAHSSPA
eukprot:tig00020555_g10968.t1